MDFQKLECEIRVLLLADGQNGKKYLVLVFYA